MLTEKQLKNYWVKVDVKGEDECWNWKACRTKKGYGDFGLGSPKKNGLAHRVSAYIAGLIPSIKSQSDNDRVLHTCDNPSCVNPKHFFIGSQQDNVDDMVKKGRDNKVKGEAVSISKLTEQDVIEIRGIYAVGTISQRSLASIYGVDHSTIWAIVNRKTWAHV
jgi:hypothetical protein